MRAFLRQATSIALRSSAAGTNRLTKPCRAFITLPRGSSAGGSALFRAVFSINLSMTTSMNSRFASTAVDQTRTDYCSTAWLTSCCRRPLSVQFHYSRQVALTCVKGIPIIGYIKGKSAIHIARVYGERSRNFVGQHFWARGYFVSTVGRDEEQIRRYIQHQEKEDERLEQLKLV